MSNDRTGIFAGEDPLQIITDWLKLAANSEPNDPNAATLATVDPTGMPNARIVLIKEVKPEGLVFFTNFDSTKGRELDQSGCAALVFHWKSLRRQIRIRGKVDRASAESADVYYNSRGLASRIGAWASNQSQVLSNREELEARAKTMAERFGDAPPRPDHWGGFNLKPTEVEFWADGADRLHDRFCWRWSAEQSNWTIDRLFP